MKKDIILLVALFLGLLIIYREKPFGESKEPKFRVVTGVLNYTVYDGENVTFYQYKQGDDILIDRERGIYKKGDIINKHHLAFYEFLIIIWSIGFLIYYFIINK